MKEQLFQYGAVGVMLAIVCWYVLYLHKERGRERKEHMQERREQQEAISRQFQRMHDMVDNQNKITQENTSVLSALKTLLELDIKLKK